MQILTLNIDGDINTSLQVGDYVYYSPLTTVANSGFSTVSLDSASHLGTITAINNPLGIEVLVVPVDPLDPTGPTTRVPAPITIDVMFDEVNITPPVDANITYYILFEKDKRVNSSSLIGYYADVKFVNYSTEKIELFSVGSEISESSK